MPELARGRLPRPVAFSVAVGGTWHKRLFAADGLSHYVMEEWKGDR